MQQQLFFSILTYYKYKCTVCNGAIITFVVMFVAMCSNRSIARIVDEIIYLITIITGFESYRSSAWSRFFGVRFLKRLFRYFIPATMDIVLQDIPHDDVDDNVSCVVVGRDHAHTTRRLNNHQISKIYIRTICITYIYARAAVAITLSLVAHIGGLFINIL